MKRVPMTPDGHVKLKAELLYQKGTLRHQIVRDIEEARAHGDISENSEFEDAKHRQALCEGRIMELEGKLSAADIIDVTKFPPSERVIFGATVEVEDLDTEETYTYRIVGVDYSDIKEGRISVSSPIGRALIGKHIGDEAEVRTPRGLRHFAINDVQYI